MDLQCDVRLAAAYKSRSQIARVLSEDWCRRELYCPACDSDDLAPTRPNSRVQDFTCPSCNQFFELKSSDKWNVRKIPDAGYMAMIQAIRQDRTPNLLILQYSAQWLVRELLLIPRAFFVESVIEKRKPLSMEARRAGWVGCNILLERIPQDGKIALVSGGAVVPANRVREEFLRIRELASIAPAIREWTVDVLAAVRRLGKRQFSLDEVYGFEAELQARHPRNRNIRPKIRQQLQILRDMRLLRFEERGRYTLLSPNEQRLRPAAP
jgi:type II restriction enzyme